MATARQKSAARKNIRKAQKARRSKSPSRRTAARSKTTLRSKTKTKTRVRAKTAKAKPRAKSTARPRTTARRREFFHIEVQPKEAFVAFKTRDIGREGGIERVAGRRAGGTWSTHEWLIAKDQAHVERGTLIGDTVDARRVLTMLGSEPRHIKADRFAIHGHTGLPAEAKPTLAPRRGGVTNVQAPQKGRKWS